MPQVKDYRAKQEMRLDCGYTIQSGESFHVTSVFTCDKEGFWPLRILMACFAVIRQKQHRRQPAQAGTSRPAAQQKPQPVTPKAP